MFLSFAWLAVSCQQDSTASKPVVEEPSLKATFKNDFLIGAALNDGHINGTDTSSLKIIEREFNTITPENIMKWMYIHPSPDSFYFEMVDKTIL